MDDLTFSLIVMFVDFVFGILLIYITYRFDRKKYKERRRIKKAFKHVSTDMQKIVDEIEKIKNVLTKYEALMVELNLCEAE